jgi:hypothetical protein
MIGLHGCARAGPNAPSFHRLVLTANAHVSSCALLRVTTGSKDTDLAAASGIGYSAAVSGGNLAPEDPGTLHPEGTAEGIRHRDPEERRSSNTA